MKISTIPELPSVAAGDHVMQFDYTLSPPAARALMKLQFAPPYMERMQDLAAKA